MERTPLYSDGGPVLRISYPLLPLDVACSFELRSPLSIPPSSFHPSFFHPSSFHPSSFHPSSFHHSKSTCALACVAAPRDAGCAFALSPAVACGPRSFSILKSTCAPACVATLRRGCALALSPAGASGPRSFLKEGGQHVVRVHPCPLRARISLHPSIPSIPSLLLHPSIPLSILPEAGSRRHDAGCTKC